jgi:hypothetical protein
MKKNTIEFRRTDQRGVVILQSSADLDLAEPLGDGSMTIKQAQEIVRERRRHEEAERKELAHDKYLADIQEALDLEFGD